ncbi:uncharacterized protein METZ01_LOCUS150154 [marine metagenome]|uniref:DUF898 domain-containing protein n=1 Tax=marine metagenome TaxID=408172 RepID=A0A382A725_9ZZZZ
MSDQDRASLEFKGSGSEYFKIWIVNLFLSILTLGIYSAWAKVRRKRYLYGNTSIKGASFEYHASPITILKGRLIAVALLIVYSVLSELFPLVGFFLLILLFAFIPWIVWRSLRFNARMTSLRNVHFSFKGRLGKSYLYYLVIPFIFPLLISTLFSFGYSVLVNEYSKEFFFYFSELINFPDYYRTEILILIVGSVSMYLLMIPYVQKIKMSYYMNNSCFGQGKFSSNISASKFYLIDILTFLVTAAVFLFPIMIFLLIYGFNTFFDYGSEFLDNVNSIVPVFLMIAVYVFMLSAMFLSTAFFTAKLRNYVYSNTQLNDNISVNSNLNTWRLYWLYLSNFFLMIFTVGLAYPWTIIRKIKYMAETVSVNNVEAFSQFVSQQEQQQSALGEEIGEAFDVGSGIEF